MLKNVIETLSAGFAVVYRRLWIVLVPVVLDLFLWLGPKISLYPLVHRWLDFMAELGTTQADNSTWASLQQLWTQMDVQQLWEQFGRQFNLWSILSTLNILSFLSLGTLELPSLAAKNILATTSLTSYVPTAQVNGVLSLIGLVIFFVGVGLLIAVIYQGLIAQQVRDENTDLRYLFRHLGAYLFRLAAVAVILLALLVIIGWPLSTLFFVVGVFSSGLMQGLFFLGSIILFWLGIYLSLVPQGILLGEEKPLSALWMSANLIHRNFWSAMFLLFLIRIIRTGLGFVWPLLARTVPGAVVAIVGNAFVSGGLAAASFVFYRDRFAAWREELAHKALSSK